MQASRFSDISAISAIVALMLGFSAAPAVATSSKCVNDGTIEVCVEWSQSMAPKEGHHHQDFTVTFSGTTAGADVILRTGDLEWRVWTTLVSGGAVADFGDITLDGGSDDFELQIFGDGEAGADDVGSIDLAGTTGYSSIRDVPALSWIAGSVDGVIKLVEDSAGAGGEMGWMLIKGSVGGLITIPTLSVALSIGTAGQSHEVAAGFVIDLLDGSLTINGTLPSPKIGEIGNMGTGTFSITLVEDGATVDLLNGMEGTGLQSQVFTLAGEIDLHNSDVLTGLFLQNAPMSGEVANGGILDALFYPSFADGDFAGTATFTSVTAAGQIYAFDVDATPDTNISGVITITGDYAGLFEVDGDFTGTLTIDGDLKAHSGDEGLIEVAELASGDVTIKGDLLGRVDYAKALTGSITVEGLTTGAISIGEETTNLSFIHLSGGLGTAGTVEINSSEGAFNAVGLIVVGLATCTLIPPDVTFDGCIRVYNDSGSGHAGDLDGAIAVCGCHNTGDLNICIDGADNGNVTISQTGCTNQVDWSCDTCP